MTKCQLEARDRRLLQDSHFSKKRGNEGRCNKKRLSKICRITENVFLVKYSPINAAMPRTRVRGRGLRRGDGSGGGDGDLHDLHQRDVLSSLREEATAKAEREHGIRRAFGEGFVDHEQLVLVGDMQEKQRAHAGEHVVRRVHATAALLSLEDVLAGEPTDGRHEGAIARRLVRHHQALAEQLATRGVEEVLRIATDLDDEGGATFGAVTFADAEDLRGVGREHGLHLAWCVDEKDDESSEPYKFSEK